MKEKREELDTGTRVKISYPIPGEPIASFYTIIGSDAVHYHVKNVLGGQTHSVPKRCAIPPQDFHLTH